jgi:hypothetical protein
MHFCSVLFVPRTSLILDVLVLSLYLPVGLPSKLFPSCFPTKKLYAFLFCLIRSTYLAHSWRFIVILSSTRRSSKWTSSFMFPYQKSLCISVVLFAPRTSLILDVLLLSFHLPVGLPSELLLSCFLTKNLYAFLFCLIPSTYLPRLTLLYVIVHANFIWWSVFVSVRNETGAAWKLVLLKNTLLHTPVRTRRRNYLEPMPLFVLTQCPS